MGDKPAKDRVPHGAAPEQAKDGSVLRVFCRLIPCSCPVAYV